IPSGNCNCAYCARLGQNRRADSESLRHEIWRCLASAWKYWVPECGGIANCPSFVWRGTRTVTDPRGTEEVGREVLQGISAEPHGYHPNQLERPSLSRGQRDFRKDNGMAP